MNQDESEKEQDKMMTSRSFGWDIYCGNPLDTERMYRNNPEEFEHQLNEFKTGLSSRSCEYLQKYINRILALPVKVGNHILLHIPDTVDFFTDEEKIVLANRDYIQKTLYAQYSERFDLGGIDFNLHIFYYECGLVFLPDEIKTGMQSKIAVDCGAYTGDSVLMLSKYGFSRIIAFEPIPEIFSALGKNIARNRLSENVICVNAAVGAKNSRIHMEFRSEGGSSIADSNETGVEVKVVKLDTHLKKYSGRVGLIKMDVEGVEEDALAGAVETIKSSKPVLLISVYHNWIAPGQMFRIKKFIEQLNLGYRFLFRASQPDVNLITEYVLIAYAEQ